MVVVFVVKGIVILLEVLDVVVTISEYDDSLNDSLESSFYNGEDIRGNINVKIAITVITPPLIILLHLLIKFRVLESLGIFPITIFIIITIITINEIRIKVSINI